ncbi:hypothetical protein EBU71_07835, partial [bacterium]|nr:hypothetical protein [Candidatus Elulimicrobium humile]
TYKTKNYTAIKNVSGSDFFVSSEWQVVNNVFKSGLAPNFSHNAAKFKDIYDIDSYTLDEQLTDLSNALIGYRSRPYFDNLGLSKNSQIKFYQGYLKTKGTQNAMLSIAQGHFDGVKDEIEIFEEWAARTGEYGAIDNNPIYTFAIKTNKTIKNPLLYWFTENLYTTLYPSFDKLSIKNLEIAPDDYDSRIFLNRPEYDKNRIWRIELFGDSIVCGKKLETDDYSIQIFKRRKYSTIIQNTTNYSLAVIEKGVDNFVNCVFNETLFDIRISGQEPVERLFVTMEPPTAKDRQLLSTKYKSIETINQIFSNQDFRVNFTSIDSDENLFITLESSTANDSPLSTTVRGDLYRPTSVIGGDEIIVASYSVDNTEPLIYEFADLADDEMPLARTSKVKPIRSEVKVCLNDKVTGRVENPPDFLLYEYLQNKFKVAITTRSVEGTTSGDLLNGTDGVNGPWPDNVDADIVLINHGLNDALNNVDVEEYKNNLRKLRKGLKSNCVFVWQLPGKIVTPTIYNEFDKTVIIANNDYFTLYEHDLSLQGTSGQEEIFIKPDVYGIVSGTLINKINVPFSLDQYEYRQVFNKLELYYEGRLQVTCELPISRDGIMLLTRQGSAKVILTDGVITIGSQKAPHSREKLVFTGSDINTDLTTTRRLGANNIKPYAMAMLEIAIEFGDYYADVYNYPDYTAYIAEDGIHLTQLGYLKINDDVIAPVIERILADISLKFKKRYEDDLPNAGYVLDSEVDAKVFDISDLLKDSSSILNDLATGYRFWVAYDFNRDWQVYRAYKTDLQIITARTDLDNKLVLGLNQVHDYNIGDLIAVRGINSMFNGVYQIFSVTDSELTVVSARDIGTTTADLDELNGELFDFQTLRFATHRELLMYTPKRPWIGQIKYTLADESAYYDIVFVDSDIDYRWTVMAVETNSLTYDTLQLQNQFLSNIYSIVGIDCSRVNSLIFAASRGDSLQFCVTSVEPSETLYYTIETPTQEEESVEFVYEYGERVETVRINQEIPIAVNSFRPLRQADEIVDIESINNIYVYSNKDKRVLETLDLFDPVKGRILSTVRQDLDYILEVDPANYSKIQTSSNLMFPKEIFWSSDQVGTYWWNTRNCKFHYYEQGDIEQRVQNWGTFFPGSRIEVYEWISSDVLPNQHVALGRDGVPLYPNNEYYSEDLFVDPLTDILSYRYFFWVKSSVEKRNSNKLHSTVNCEILISDPIRQNIPYLAAVRDDSVAVYNVSEYLAKDEIVLYIGTKRRLNEQIIHSEFKLLQEFDRDSLFPERIESKLIDSVIGADNQGNLVPDPRLSKAGSIGLGTVPQQTLIENFLEARRNLVDYVNNILIKHPIRTRLIDEKDVISDNFFAREPIPPKSVGQISSEAYFLVTDNLSANKLIIKLVDPAKIRQARNQLNDVQSLYHVSGLVIKGSTLYNNLYSFYFDPDSITFFRENEALGKDNWDFNLIEAYVNSLPPNQTGKAVRSENFYVFSSYLLEEVTARVLGYDFYEISVDSREQLFTQYPLRENINILVTNDTAQDGKWSIYRRSLISDPEVEFRYELVLVRKQAFDTSQYWNYVDWFAPGYNKETLINHIVSNYYELYTKTLSIDDIVYIGKQQKYQNRSEISFAFLTKLNNFELYRVTAVKDGDFSLELIGLGNGTIQLSPKLYQAIGYDRNEYDVNSHDVTTFQEMRYIIQGLRDDVFIGDLKSEYNRMLFMIVEYILSKQKYIDWFFKTSFITVKKSTPSFDQRSHIIRDKEGSIREYIEEVKPYKTKIRQFIPRHTGMETYPSSVTDFDLPPYYDTNLMKFRSPNGEEPQIDGPLFLKPQYKDWYENYKYRLDSLLISSGGFGFTNPPEVEFYRRDSNTKTKPNVVVGIDSLSSSINKVRVEEDSSDFTLTPRTYLLGDGGSQNFQYKKYEFIAVSIGYSALYAPMTFTRYLQFKRGYGLYASDSQLNITKYYEKSLIKADNWQLGPGDATGFGQNGLISENQRIFDTDPWNQKSLVWEARPSGDGGADGGWNGAYFPIDKTKIYRSSVWIRRTSLSSDGLFYHGLYTNGSVPAYDTTYVPNGNVVRFGDGLGEWNPYWDYAYTNSYAKDEWYLHVGHIFPTQYFADVVHPDSGIYNRTGKKIRPNGGNIANDCKFPANATMAMQRVYLYYSNNSTMRGQFAYPRWDLIDGTEPTIQDLLDIGPYMDVKYNEPKRGYTLHRIRRADGQVAF